MEVNVYVSGLTSPAQKHTLCIFLGTFLTRFSHVVIMSFFFHSDKSTQHQVILQARSAAPLMRMEGVFWQGVSLICKGSLSSAQMYTVLTRDRL